MLPKYLKEDKREYRYLFLSQRENKGILLIAWFDDLPIGRLWIRWMGSHEISRIKDRNKVAASIRNCPAFDDIYVNKDYRDTGVGTTLIKYAEKISKRNGYKQVALTTCPRSRS